MEQEFFSNPAEIKSCVDCDSINTIFFLMLLKLGQMLAVADAGFAVRQYRRAAAESAV